LIRSTAPHAVASAPGAVRLAGGPSPREGRLEVQLPSGRWRSVCESEGWLDYYFPSWNPDQLPLARHVCKHLGYGGGVPRGAAF